MDSSTRPHYASILILQSIIFGKKPQYLLLRKVDEYCFPGGKAESGEYIYDTLIREVEEETGLNISKLGLCLVYLGVVKSATGLPVHCFAATIHTRPNIVLSSEHNKFVWWTKKKINKDFYKLRGNTSKFFEVADTYKMSKSRASLMKFR